MSNGDVSGLPLDFQKSGGFGQAGFNEDGSGETKVSSREIISERITYLTRALVKNNVITQNSYIALLTIEYICMMYYVLRIVDYTTLYKGFKFVEDFLDIEKHSDTDMAWDQIQAYQSGTLALTTDNVRNMTLQNFEDIASTMRDRAHYHLIFNCFLCGIYTFFLILFFQKVSKVTSFDKTQEQSFSYKAMSSFLVLSKTVMKIPVVASILIVAKGLSLGLISTQLFYVSLICNTLLALEFSLVVIYALKFFNLEVPNDDIAWSHNQTSGLYFKLALVLLLVSQEIYRNSLGNMAVTIIVLAFILIVEFLVLIYRMNTPNIFNTIIHDYTLLLESLVISLTLIGMMALITQRDILSTMAYLCIFIPVIIKIFYSIDQSRKHFVLFKLKNEENLSSNEYLIAITHLLKMIRRQSETDLAQLLSFTYYHKLYCYDTGCICQFFTQYCQDPIKFKLKKRRTYRGYKDDGNKLVQQHDEELQTSGTTQELGPSYKNGPTGNLENDEHSVINMSSQPSRIAVVPSQALNHQNPHGTTNLGGQRQQDVMMMGLEPSAPTNPNIQVNVFQTNATAVEIYDSNIDYPNREDRNQQNEIDMNGATSALTRQEQQNQDSQDATNASNNGYGNNNVDHKESGISALFTKNQVLKGQAFNGFDSNLDFKIKGEFKSPSQFKTTHESRTYFFTRLLETLFKQLEQRTKKNVSFTLISIYFNFVYQHNIYLSALNLVKIAKALNQSTLQKMTFSVTEYYLLEMIMNEFKHHTKDEIDYTSFIDSSQMQQKLDWLFEDASQDIIQFWRIFKEEQANVQKAYHLAMVISKNIVLIREYTTKLEEKQLIKDYNKYYYYAMFYQNLLNDRQSYNQMINNLRNLIMVKNMQRKNSRFGGNIQDINDIGFAIFAIEDAGVQDKNVGKFIYCNKSACAILNVSEEEVLGKAASLIMPEQIRMYHDQFVKRFFQDGLNRLIGKVRNMYVRDFNGYIKPVQFFINFFYNSKFGYSIIMHLDPINTLTYFGSSSLISMKHCMIFLCTEDGVVQNMTENVRKIIGLTHKRVREEEEILGRALKIDDLIANYTRIEISISNNKLNFFPNQPVKLRNFRGQSNASQAANVALNNGNDVSTIQCSMTYEEIIYLKNYPGQFSEKIFLLIPNTKIPELIDSGSGSGGAFNNGSSVNNPNQSSDQNNGVDSNSALSKSTAEINDQLTPSCSSIGSSSSISSSTGIANTKNLLFQQKSPKILNLYLSIIFGVFVSFMIITSINFIIYIQKKNNVNLQIQYNQIINQRNIYLTSTILDLKMLQLISQSKTLLKGTPNISNIFEPPMDANRFGQYGDLLFTDQDILQTNHQQFKMMSQRYEELTANQDLSKLSKISYQVVSDKGTLYLQNNTLDFGIQLLISNIAMVKPNFFVQETIPMNLNEYLGNLTSNKTVSQLFKNLLYIYRNGMSHINSLIRLENDYILDNTIKTSSNSNLFINLISFISIGMITAIGIFTFPMLGKIEDRKISVLKFFNLLNVEQILSLIQKGEDYREEFQSLQRNVNKQKMENTNEDDSSNEDDDAKMNDEYGASFIVRQLSEKIGLKDKNSRSSKYYEEEQKAGDAKISQLAIPATATTQSMQNQFGSKQGLVNKSLNSSQQDKMRKKITNQNAAGIRNIFKRIKENEENMKESYNRRKSKLSGGKGTSSQNLKSSGLALKNAFNTPNEEDDKAKRQNKYKVEEEIKEAEEEHHSGDSQNKKGKKVKKNKKKLNNADNVNGGNEDSQDDQSMEQSSEDDDDQNKSKKKKKNHLGYDSDSNRNGIGMKGFQSANTRTDHINDQLEKVALKEKIKLAFYVFFVLLFLNSCLIACFSIGQTTFKEDSKAVFSLTTFYHRQNCLDNLLLYSMEQIIQNKTIEIGSNEPDAVEFYIDYCQRKERDFNELRKNLPVFLESSQSQIDNLESSNLCKTIYKATEIQTIERCESVYDEIMKRGFTQTLYTIFNYAQSINVRFQKEARTKEFLNRFIYEDQKLRDLTDLVKSYIHDAFQFIQTIVTDNAVAYFNQLAQYYMIIYGCYMGISILMCLIFGLFIFKKLRQQIITSANILAIMPLEDLDSRDRQKIETFLNS